MTTHEDYEARIAELEAQIAELTTHIPRMLSIMLKMQAHLETQHALQIQKSRRPATPPRQPFMLDDGWLVA